jgi:hypothetical protein
VKPSDLGEYEENVREKQNEIVENKPSNDNKENEIPQIGTRD